MTTHAWWPESFIGVHSFAGGTRRGVFRIPTKIRGDVFMAIDLVSPYGIRTSVVEVDAARLLALWRQPVSSHIEIAVSTPRTWQEEREYSWCDHHFEIGVISPVPLAHVNCRRVAQDVTEVRRRFLLPAKRVLVAQRGTPFISFVDGITSTTWLLANEAPIFPISCPASCADLLQSLAGLPGRSAVDLSELGRQRDSADHTVDKLDCTDPSADAGVRRTLYLPSKR